MQRDKKKRFEVLVFHLIVSVQYFVREDEKKRRKTSSFNKLNEKKKGVSFLELITSSNFFLKDLEEKL